MMTPREEEKGAWVPEHEVPVLGDKSRHVNKLYAQWGRGGALPVDEVVIQDMSSMYNEMMNSNIFDLYEVGDLREEDRSLPFVHGVELAGPKGEAVRFRSMFDDRASVNTIDETLYQTQVNGINTVPENTTNGRWLVNTISRCLERENNSQGHGTEGNIRSVQE